mmetsp:Transcript_10829/g.23205  ORF Transcript_10829/g.23205 Transcript_10829/m.23205 type:complete len:270 (-) Transcript_10829:158-967(-)
MTTDFGLKKQLMLRIHERSFGSQSFYGIVAMGLVAITIALQFSGFSNVQASLLQADKSKFDGSGWSLLNRPAQKFVHAVESFAPSWAFQGVEGKFDRFHDSEPEVSPSYSGSDSKSYLDSNYVIQIPKNRFAKSNVRKPSTAVKTFVGNPSASLTTVSKQTPSWINLRAKRLLQLLDAPPTHIRGPPHLRRESAVARRIKLLSAEQAPRSVTAVLANHRLSSASRAVPPAHPPPVSPSNLKRQLSAGGMRLFTDRFHPLAGASPMRKAG